MGEEKTEAIKVQVKMDLDVKEMEELAKADAKTQAKSWPHTAASYIILLNALSACLCGLNQSRKHLHRVMRLAELFPFSHDKKGFGSCTDSVSCVEALRLNCWPSLIK